MITIVLEYTEPTGFQVGGLYRLTAATDGTPAYSMQYDEQATRDAEFGRQVREERAMMIAAVRELRERFKQKANESDADALARLCKEAAMVGDGQEETKP